MSVAAGWDSGAPAARSAARQILSERRFRSPSLPRPLHGVLHDVGHAISRGAHAVVHAVDSVGSVVPGGPAVVWILLALALLALARLVSARYARRVLLAAPGARAADSQQRPGALERAAEQAERDGKLGEAVRLRFRAGLLRLAERGTIRTGVSIPSSEVSGALRSPEFDSLARRFDEIAYGEAPAARQDVDQARHAWREVLRDSPRT